MVQDGPMGELLLGGRYRLEELLGSGGMSVVWLARDEVLHRAVAVKVLHLRDGTARDRIRGEARAAAALSHPNLAQVHDFGDDGFPFLVMELVAGRTLQQHLDERELPPQEAFRICAGVAAGLAAAHAASLVHQDVKPANIMVTATGAKLVDFGLAAPAGPQPLEDILGTPAYLAPERLSGHVVPPSDVYALGVLLYRLLAGTLPWTADTTTQLILDHVFTPPLPLPALPGVPDAVAALCMACLAKEPDTRPSAETVAGVLTAATAPEPPPPPGSLPALAGGLSTASAASAAEPGSASGSVSAAGSGAEPEPRSRARRYLLAAVVLLVAAAFPWLLAGLDRADRQRGAGAAATAGPSEGTPGAGPGAGPSGAAPSGAAPSGAVPSGPGATGSGPPTGAAVQPGEQPGAGQPTATSSPAATAATTTTAPTPTTFTSEAGAVDVACAGGGQVRVITVAANRSYKAQSQQAGPAETAFVEFRHGNDFVRMSFTCPAGTPVGNVTRSTH
jgi:serine/threonine-protein kinase